MHCVWETLPHALVTLGNDDDDDVSENISYLVGVAPGGGLGGDLEHVEEFPGL